MINIRQAKIEDTDSIKLLIFQFYEESLREYKLSFDWDTLTNTITTFINSHIGLVAEKDGVIIGVIGGVVTNSIFDAKQKVGQEAIWYVDKSERKGTVGIRLLKAFEEECKKRGVNFVIMICMCNLYTELLDRYYKSKHYQLLENHYIKEV